MTYLPRQLNTCNYAMMQQSTVADSHLTSTPHHQRQRNMYTILHILTTAQLPGTVNCRLQRTNNLWTDQAIRRWPASLGVHTTVAHVSPTCHHRLLEQAGSHQSGSWNHQKHLCHRHQTIQQTSHNNNVMSAHRFQHMTVMVKVVRWNR